MFMLVFAFISCKGIATQDLSFVTDVQTLSELPLKRLLEIKKTFHVEDEDVPEVRGDLEDESPQAMALQSKKRPKDRDGSYHTYHYVEEPSKKSGKMSKTQSIFQISVTTLAFLAFGGYLICLLVQAVKGKSNYDNMSTATQIMSALVNSQVVRRKGTRAPQRFQNQRPMGGGYRRKRRRRPRPKREVTSDTVENMYYALIDMSEGYTKYHTNDYVHYNSSMFLQKYDL